MAKTRTSKRRTRQKPKRTQTRRRTAPRQRQARLTVPHAIVEKVCSNFDPFCSQAMGAKTYDTNTAPSLTYSNRQTFAVVTDANGKQLIWWQGAPTYYINNATIVGSNVTAWTSTDSTFANVVSAANIGRWRIVSSGLQYFTTQAWTTASGFINISEISEPFDPVVVGQNAASKSFGYTAKTIPLRDAKITCVSRGKGMQNLVYRNYTDNDSGYTGFVLYFDGVPNTTVGYLNIVTNYEWTPDSGSGYNTLASPAAPNLPMIRDSVNHLSELGNNIKTITDGIATTQGYMAEAKQAIHTVTGIVDDVAAIGGMVSPAMRGLGLGSGLVHALTAR